MCINSRSFHFINLPFFIEKYNYLNVRTFIEILGHSNDTWEIILSYSLQRDFRLMHIYWLFTIDLYSHVSMQVIFYFSSEGMNTSELQENTPITRL